MAQYWAGRIRYPDSMENIQERVAVIASAWEFFSWSLLSHPGGNKKDKEITSREGRSGEATEGGTEAVPPLDRTTRQQRRAAWRLAGAPPKTGTRGRTVEIGRARHQDQPEDSPAAAPSDRSYEHRYAESEYINQVRGQLGICGKGRRYGCHGGA